MASVNWLKANVQKAGAMTRHNGRKERVEGNHSNEHIDKNKSYLNIYIGADDWSDMVDKVKTRIEEVDKEHPPLKITKDRVTCFLLETPVPRKITERGQAADFLKSAHKVFEDFFGADNVGGTVGHFDEQHLYVGEDGKEHMSLVHGHSVVAAYVEWSEEIRKSIKQPNGKYKQVKTGETRERAGINGKAAETKARLKALNKAMDEMCRREYGISYNTAETPEHKSVERLKEETKLREQADTLRAQIKDLETQRDTSLRNYVNGVPPLELEDKPPRPAPPEPPEHKYVFFSTGEEKEHNKKVKEYEKAQKAYERKTLPNWENECNLINARNMEKEQKWKNTYGTQDNLRKAQQQIQKMLLETNSKNRLADIDRAKAKAEREKAEQERKTLEQSVQDEALRLAQEREAELFAKDGKSRAARLEAFCEGITFTDGSTVLEAFEEQERQLKNKYYKER